jgi:hypothetical protein
MSTAGRHSPDASTLLKHGTTFVRFYAVLDALESKPGDPHSVATTQCNELVLAPALGKRVNLVAEGEFS